MKEDNINYSRRGFEMQAILRDPDYFYLFDCLSEEGVTGVDASFAEGILSFYGETSDGGFLSVDFDNVIHPIRLWLTSPK